MKYFDCANNRNCKQERKTFIYKKMGATRPPNKPPTSSCKMPKKSNCIGLTRGTLWVGGLAGAKNP